MKIKILLVVLLISMTAMCAELKIGLYKQVNELNSKLTKLDGIDDGKYKMEGVYAGLKFDIGDKLFIEVEGGSGNTNVCADSVCIQYSTDIYGRGAIGIKF